jgi:poly-gamma-glutamate synthesis protein (capsule biosynthesis protein)
MTGRGVDQILAAPCDPAIDEPWMKSALDYVLLAEEVSGPIPRGVEPAYVWGDALGELERERPAARIVNLETAVTHSNARAAKGINYRMSPANAACLAAARIDCCVLANNHVLDWGRQGLEETLGTLRALGMRTVGAGRDADEAEAPARVGENLLVFAFGLESAGVTADWAAGAATPGVSWLPDLSPQTADAVAERILGAKRPGDVAVVSVHWGPNWGYEVSPLQRGFARRLVDAGAADLVHGHSSHHPGAIEIYRDRLILYACGDLLNDYEGISGHESFRPRLALMYFPTLAAGGALAGLSLSPLQVRRFRLERATEDDAEWLAAVLRRESRRSVERTPEGLRLR